MDGDRSLSCFFPWDEGGDSASPLPYSPPASQTNQWRAQTLLWACARLSTDLLSHGVRWGGINEAPGNGTERGLRKEGREVHPQQLQRGSELGAAGKPCCRAPACPPPRLPCQPSVNALSLQTKVQGPCALCQADPFSNRNPPVNKGGLVSPCMWGLSFEWGSPGWVGLQGHRAAPVPWPWVGLGSCPLPGANLNQLRPSGMELLRSWHQTLIRRDPVPS